MKEPERGHPLSEHADHQAANISHGSGEPFHHTHPSDLRRHNRAEAPVEVTHHADKPHDPAATAREHRERLERHARTR